MRSTLTATRVVILSVSPGIAAKSHSGEKEACLQSPGWVWALPSWTWYSLVVWLSLLCFTSSELQKTDPKRLSNVILLVNTYPVASLSVVTASGLIDVSDQINFLTNLNCSYWLDDIDTYEEKKCIKFVISLQLHRKWRKQNIRLFKK